MVMHDLIFGQRAIEAGKGNPGRLLPNQTAARIQSSGYFAKTSLAKFFSSQVDPLNLT
jgi:hypothetical protein